ncbi:hypothetical protein [Sulfitobacter sp. R18_1]|uniref:hypothetical protein n=1 Tax=Sulfitobacter sp. R18_1 TaxID=2821104 RepID=UPI001ADB9799|nr:hypothetical protein [Sulfitobacter sp. R18_1]MBO9428026.1 hypothetical protein [Sulfitobacter sp. R18_1]
MHEDVKNDLLRALGGMTFLEDHPETVPADLNRLKEDTKKLIADWDSYSRA